MKRCALFFLMLFIFFIFEFRLANGLGTGQCHFYDTSSGGCLDGKIFDSRDYITAETVSETQQTVTEVSQQPEITTQFFTLVFQFFSIVILFIILVILIESILENK